MEFIYSILFMAFSSHLVATVLGAEFDGRKARKENNVRYFLRMSNGISYRVRFSMLLIYVMIYFIFSVEKMFSTMWFLQLLIFIAVGAIGDIIARIIHYYYINYRFKKMVEESIEIKQEIEEVANNQSEEMMQQSIPSYDSHKIVENYFSDDKHVAIVSVDGGKFTADFNTLPPITYSVEVDIAKTRGLLENKGVKVTSFTDDGKMPFKDEKIDLVVNELSNYDKFEMYRILKPGGYLVVDQLGSDNYKEIINMFVPFKIKGQWNRSSCQDTLKEIGFEIVDSYEDMGSLRFESLSAIMAFMRTISPERVNRYELFVNFYAGVVKKIKELGFYEITTHKFMVIARKKDV